MSKYKNLIKQLFRKVGIEIHSFIPSMSPDAQMIAILKHFNIDLVIDIGANVGQFSQELRKNGYSGRIISFEPQKDEFEELLKQSSDDPKWIIHQRCAVGDFDGEVELNISKNSVSSSLLKMLDTHLIAAPDSLYIRTESVRMVKIDSVFNECRGSTNDIFLKIDTQGFEWKILDGAENSLNHIKCILLEMSFVPLYDGQHLWEETINRMRNIGFELWAFLPGFIDPVTGRAYQTDGIFYNKNLNCNIR